MSSDALTLRRPDLPATAAGPGLPAAAAPVAGLALGALPVAVPAALLLPFGPRAYLRIWEGLASLPIHSVAWGLYVTFGPAWLLLAAALVAGGGLRVGVRALARSAGARPGVPASLAVAAAAGTWLATGLVLGLGAPWLGSLPFLGGAEFMAASLLGACLVGSAALEEPGLPPALRRLADRQLGLGLGAGAWLLAAGGVGRLAHALPAMLPAWGPRAFTIFGDPATARTHFQLLAGTLLAWALVAPLTYGLARLSRRAARPGFAAAALAGFGLFLLSDATVVRALLQVLTRTSPGGLARALVLGLPLALGAHAAALRLAARHAAPGPAALPAGAAPGRVPAGPAAGALPPR